MCNWAWISIILKAVLIFLSGTILFALFRLALIFFLLSCTEGSLVAFVFFATVSAQLVAFEKDILRNVLVELGVPTLLAADILTYETESCYWRPGCCMLL